MINKIPVVLIVDDMATNIHALSSVLKDEYEIKVATSGSTAIKIAKNQEKLDLILLDIEMPEMDGYEVLKELKSDPQTKSIPVIFVTARDDIRDEEKGFDIGAVDYITKPFHPAIVRARVRNQVNLKMKSDLLEELAMIDGLTHIPNRRYFDEAFGERFTDAKRSQRPISVIMVDIDYFKIYNDNYGHGQGDTCLKLIAKTLSSTLKRPSDLVARYGGEEFVAVLPNTDENGALTIANSFLENVRKLQLPHERSQVEKYVTISVGVATMTPSKDTNADGLLKSADEMLYQAKNSGRNRVVG